MAALLVLFGSLAVIFAGSYLLVTLAEWLAGDGRTVD